HRCFHKYGHAGPLGETPYCLHTPVAGDSTTLPPDRLVPRLLLVRGLAALDLAAPLWPSWHGCTLWNQVPASVASEIIAALTPGHHVKVAALGWVQRFQPDAVGITQPLSWEARRTDSTQTFCNLFHTPLVNGWPPLSYSSTLYWARKAGFSSANHGLACAVHSKRNPRLADSCIDLTWHTAIVINTTSNVRETLHNFECLPWIVSGVFSDCVSMRMTLHFVGAKCIPKQGDYSGHFIEKHLCLLLLEDENGIICIFQVDKVFVTSSSLPALAFQLLLSRLGMAILGFQLVTTLIGACILSKIVTYFSCTRFVFDGLSRFMAPSDQLLIEASGNFKTRNKNKKRRTDATNGSNSNTSSQDRFFFPRASPIQLQSSVITNADASVLPLYSSFQWLLDFTVCTFGIYLVTELANSSLLSSHNWAAISPSRSSTSNSFSLSTRLNLSLVWLALVVWFTLRVLVSMTAIYFSTRTPEFHKSESRPSISSTAPGANSGEWFLVIVTGFCFLILTGFFMALDGRYFEFELHPAYANLTMNTTVSPGVPLISWGAFNAILAFTCASIGALFVYPGMKFGRTYLDAVSKGQTSVYQRLLFHLTFIMPLFSLLLWIKPITDHLLRSLTTLSFSHIVMQQPSLLALITVSMELLSTQIGTLRLLSCLFVVLLRISLTRLNLQV
ncbi:hypothetical protein T265_15009, partial [Opisthorchis viverrini]